MICTESWEGCLIDCHVHILPPDRLRGLLRWMHRRFPDHPISDSITADQIHEEIRQQGIQVYFNLVYPLRPEETEPLNQFNQGLASHWPAMIPFASIHPENPSKEVMILRLIENDGFLGIKFHPFIQRFDPFSPSMEPVYAALNAFRRPLFLHTGYEEFYGQKMPAKRFRDLARRFPDMVLVLVHMLFPYLEEAFSLVEEFPNIYLDATNVFGSLAIAVNSGDRKTLCDLRSKLEKGLERYKGRIMFGSDHPAGMGDLSGIYREACYFPISGEARQWLFYRTAKEFLERFGKYIPIKGQSRVSPYGTNGT